MDEITVNDIMAEIYFKKQVNVGLKELDEGEWISHKEVEIRMARWLKREG